ncbi:hypothetical protein ScalyP_jg1278 [Parmales sp. scaly parma]|nr:hypothetical protein ScalyP_jg1278 [Parmales sp. scaly parma]
MPCPLGDVPTAFPLRPLVSFTKDCLAVEEGRLREKISVDLLSAGTHNDNPKFENWQWHHCKLVKGPSKTHYNFAYENEDTFALSAKRVGDDFYISNYRLFPAAVNTNIEDDVAPPCQYIAVLKKCPTPKFTWKLYLTASDSTSRELDDQGSFEIATILHGIKRLEEAKADIRTIKCTIPNVSSIDFSHKDRRKEGEKWQGERRDEEDDTKLTDLFGEPITNENDDNGGEDIFENEKQNYKLNIMSGLGTNVWSCFPSEPVLHGQKTTMNRTRSKRGEKEKQTLRLHNKCPVWNADIGSLVLRFDRGRVQMASAKNFLLCHEGDTGKEADDAILQFGKSQKSCYALDYKHPLSPLQALGICLSTFAWEQEIKN